MKFPLLGLIAGLALRTWIAVSAKSASSSQFAFTSFSLFAPVPVVASAERVIFLSEVPS